MATLARGRLATNRIIYSRLAVRLMPPYYFITVPVCPVREPYLPIYIQSKNGKGRRGRPRRGRGGGSKNRTKRSVYSEQKSGAELFSCRTAHPPVEDNQKCLISFSAPCTRDISSRFCTYAFTSTGAKLNVPGEETPQRISECMIVIYPERQVHTLRSRRSNSSKAMRG